MVDILHRVGIQAPPDEVYAALTRLDGLAGWWTRDTQGDPRPGGSLVFRFTAGGVEIGAFEIRVLEVEPQRLVLWQVQAGPDDWIGTRLRFELKQEGEHCIVLFKHQGWREASESMHHCSTKWAVFLLSLKSLVETGQGRPSPGDLKIDNWN